MIKYDSNLRQKQGKAALFLAFLSIILALFLINLVSANITTCGYLNTENGVYDLTQNVTSTGTCFNVNATNVTLNCNGYKITHNSDGGNNEYGIQNNKYKYFTVKNCIIFQGSTSGVSYPIIFNNVNYSTIINNTITSNADSLYIYNSSSNNISFNLIIVNGNNEYGIHILDNSFYNNFSTITINTTNPNAAGIFIEGNTNKNIFENMNIKTSGIGSYGIYDFDGNNNFIIKDSIINASQSYDLYVRGLVTGGEINLTNVTNGFLNELNITKRAFEDGGISTINVFWYLDVNVSNSTGMLENANVSIWNNNTKLIYSEMTNVAGGITRQTIQAYQLRIVPGADNFFYYTPHTINTTYASYETNTTIVNFSSRLNTFLNITLIIGNPLIDYVSPTPDDGTTIATNTFIVAVNVIETNLVNVTGNLYNSTNDLINNSQFNTTEYLCYQEFANVSTSCGGLNTGSYAIDLGEGGYSAPATNAYDGNWDTETFCLYDYKYFYVNYTKPSNALSSSKWKYKGTDGYSNTLNFSFSSGNASSCWEAYPNKLVLRAFATNTEFVHSYIYCYNSSNWLTITEVGAFLYEEAMFWNISDVYSQTYYNLSDGLYYYNVTATDTSNNKNSTLTRNITIDATNPNINITYPSNNSYYLNNTLDIEYIVSDTNLQSCWYSNDTYSENITIACGINITTITWIDAQHNFTIWANDTIGNINSSFVRFTIDTTSPTITLLSPANNTYTNLTTINFTAKINDTGVGLKNATFFLYNSTGIVNRTDFIILNNATTIELGANIDGLTDGNYNWTYEAYDSLNNYNISSNFTITIDTTYPLIDFDAATLANNTNISHNFVYINVTWTEINFANITFNLYNSTWKNSTTYSTPTYLINFTDIANGYYYYNVTITDKANNFNSTNARYILLDINASKIVQNYTIPSGTGSRKPATNNTYSNESNVTFEGNITSDFGISNISITIQNQSGSIINQTNVSTGGILNYFIGIPLTLLDGIYDWIVSSYDIVANFVTTTWTRLTVDTTDPNVNIYYPENVSYNHTITAFNYTLGETNPNTCWYSLDLGVTNTTLPCGDLNVSGILSAENSNTWRIYTNDSAGNLDEDNVTFLVDTIYPLIDWGAGVSPDGTNTTIGQIYQNIDFIETNFKNTTFKVYNATHLIAIVVMNFPYNFTTWVFPNGKYWHNVTLCDQANNCNSTSTRTIILDSTPPRVVINAPSSLVDFGYIGKNETLNWSVSDALLVVSSIWYNYNGTNVSVYGLENTTIFTVKYDDTNLTFFANDSLGNRNETNFGWDYRVFLHNETYVNSTISGVYNLFSANLTYNSSFTNILVLLNYNGTNYTMSTLNTGTTRLYNYSLSAPVVASQTNYTFNFIFGITNSSGTYYINSNNRQQTVNPFLIDNCTLNSNVLFNMTMIDEETLLGMNGTIEFLARIYAYGTDTIVATYNKTFNYITPIPARVCVNTTNTYRLDYTIKHYGNISYFKKYRNAQNLTINSTNYKQTLTLYNLLIASGYSFRIIITGSIINNVLVSVYKQYVAENDFPLVESPITSPEDEAIAYLIPQSSIYNFTVSYMNRVLGRFDGYQVTCQNPSIGQCTIILNLAPIIPDIPDYSSPGNVSIVNYLNNTAHILYTVFSTTDGIAHNVSQLVIRNDGYGNTTICSSSSISTSGTITCTIPTLYQNTSFFLQTFADGVLRGSTLFTQGENPSWYGVDILIELLMYSSLVLLMLSHPILIVLGAMIGIGLSIALLFVAGGNFSSILATLIFFIAGGTIVIWQISRKI